MYAPNPAAMRSRMRSVLLGTWWARRLAAVTSLTMIAATCIAVFGTPPAGALSVNALYDNWQGQPQWSLDTTFDEPDMLKGTVQNPSLEHSETSVVYWQGQWFMYHRVSTYYPNGSQQMSIGLSTSTDGNDFTYHGVILAHGVPHSVGCYRMINPRVLIEPSGGLTMVMETLSRVDAGVQNPTPAQQLCDRAYGGSIGISHSSDGYTWTAPRDIILGDPPGGRNYGTPDITLHNGSYYVTYHVGGLGPLQQGVAIVSNVTHGNQIATIPPSSLTQMTLTNESGSAVLQGPGVAPTGDFNAGFGQHDIIQFQQGSPGVGDGAYYMVLEAFKHSAGCFDDNSEISILLARASTPAGPWAVGDQPLLGLGNFPNNYRREMCGYDMPSWQYKDGHYYIIITDANNTQNSFRLLGLQRLRLWTYPTENGLGWLQDDLGGALTSDPDSTSWGAGRLDAVVRGTDAGTYWQYYSAGWSGWIPLGGGAVAGPSIVSWGANHLDVFVVGSDYQVWHNYYLGSSWSGWQPLGTPPPGLSAHAPEAVSWASGRIDLFARGNDGALWQLTFNGGWSTTWVNLGGGIAGGPGATSQASGSLHVFARGTDNALWFRRYTGGSWTGWASLGGTLTSDPDAADWGSVQVAVAYRDSAGRVRHVRWDGAIWSVHEAISATVVSNGPSITAWASGRYDVFVRGVSGSLVHFFEP
jgi:hypothetical protein